MPRLKCKNKGVDPKALCHFIFRCRDGRGPACSRVAPFPSDMLPSDVALTRWIQREKAIFADFAFCCLIPVISVGLVAIGW